MAKYEPMYDRIFVRRDEAPEKVGEIIAPIRAQEGLRPSEGEVVAVGPGRRAPTGELIEMQVKEGDRILYGKHAGTPQKIGDEELLIIQEGEVVARIVD